MGVVKRPRTGEKLEKADWVSEAVKLATLGWSIRRIAKKVNRAHSTVSEALAKELEARKPDPEQVELARKLKAERLHRQLEAWVPRSIGTEKNPGRANAAFVVAKFEELLARLEGTDSPKRTEITGGDGAPLFDVSKLTDEQLERLAGGTLGGADRDPGEGGVGETSETSSEREPVRLHPEDKS